METFTYSENDRQESDRFMRNIFVFQYIIFIPFMSAMAVLLHAKYLTFDPTLWITMILIFWIPGCLIHGTFCRLMKKSWTKKLIIGEESIVWEYGKKFREIPFHIIRKICRQDNSQGGVTFHSGLHRWVDDDYRRV